MNYELVIKADTNDGDYVTSTTTVTEKEIEQLKSILDVIKAKFPQGKWRHNWAVGDVARPGEGPEDVYKGLLTPEQIEWFDDLCPHGEYGIHTIESVIYYPLPDKVSLL